MVQKIDWLILVIMGIYLIGGPNVFDQLQTIIGIVAIFWGGAIMFDRKIKKIHGLNP